MGPPQRSTVPAAARARARAPARRPPARAAASAAWARRAAAASPLSPPPERPPARSPPAVVVAAQAEEMRLGAPAAAASPPAAAVSAPARPRAIVRRRRQAAGLHAPRPPPGPAGGRRVRASGPARLRPVRPGRAPPSAGVPEREPAGLDLSLQPKRDDGRSLGPGGAGPGPAGPGRPLAFGVAGRLRRPSRPSPRQVGRGLPKPGGRRLCNFVRAVSLQKNVSPGARGVGCAVAPRGCPGPRPRAGVRRVCTRGDGAGPAPRL